MSSAPEHGMRDHLRSPQRAALRARAHQRLEVAAGQLARVPLVDVPRREEDEVLQAGSDGVLLVERVESLAAAGIVDEDELGLEGELGNGIVVLKNDLVGTARHPLVVAGNGLEVFAVFAAAEGDAQQFPERLEIALLQVLLRREHGHLRILGAAGLGGAGHVGGEAGTGPRRAPWAGRRGWPRSGYRTPAAPWPKAGWPPARRSLLPCRPAWRPACGEEWAATG